MGSEPIKVVKAQFETPGREFPLGPVQQRLVAGVTVVFVAVVTPYETICQFQFSCAIVPKGR